MANYSVLKAAVEAVVKTNGNQEITGANLQTTILSIIDSLGAGYQFMGLATPSTEPGTPDYNVMYIGADGVYSNFGTSVTIPAGSIGIFSYNGTWHQDVILVNDETVNSYRVDKNHIFSIPASNPDTVHYEATSSYDNIQLPILTNTVKKIVLHNVTPTRFIFFNADGFLDENYVGRNVSGDVPDGAKLVSVTISHANLPASGYKGVFIEFVQEEVDVSYMNPYIYYKPLGNNYIDKDNLMYGYRVEDGVLSPSQYGILSNKLYLESGKTYTINSSYAIPSNDNHVIVFFSAEDEYIGRQQIAGGASTDNLAPLTFTYSPMAGADHCRIELAANRVSYTAIDLDTVQLEEGDESTSYEAYTGNLELRSPLITEANIQEYIGGDPTGKLMKVIKNGTALAVRTSLNDTNDIVITMKEDSAGLDMTFNAFYVGAKTLSDGAIVTDTYKIRTINDMVGAIGVSSFWFLYAQHGWTIPRFTQSSSVIDSTDVGAVWKDQNNRQFTIGQVSGNYVYLLPVITQNQQTGIYSASWNGSLAYPNTLTWVSGGTHTGTVTGSASRYDLHIQTISNRKFIADGMEIADGTYYCDELVIKENIVGHNVGKATQWFPTPVYNGSLIDFDRSFTFKGASCTCNTTINCQSPFIITDYRGCIPMMPLVIGNYNSYSMIPKVKKLVNSHRVDVPFNSDDGTIDSNYVSVTRNTTDLYDVDDQPERCICYLKDNSDNYLVGMAGGCSLLRGLSKKEIRNQYVPTGQNTCTYGGDSTLNKFYPKILQSAGFTGGVVDDTFINELSCYFCWFDPNANDGQVYWYKDGDDYIIYVHNQSSHDKLAITLPSFMEGLVVSDTIEKTTGATLLTEQVVGGRLYVKFDTENDIANYIVFKIK